MWISLTLPSQVGLPQPLPCRRKQPLSPQLVRVSCSRLTSSVWRIKWGLSKSCASRLRYHSGERLSGTQTYALVAVSSCKVHWCLVHIAHATTHELGLPSQATCVSNLSVSSAHATTHELGRSSLATCVSNLSFPNASSLIACLLRLPSHA